MTSQAFWVGHDQNVEKENGETDPTLILLDGIYSLI
jgi:hypothetical protein